MMATMQDFGGLLFGGGGTGLEDYLSADQQSGIRNQALLQAAAALLSAGGPSERPVSIGQALGGALQAGSQGYQQAQQGAVQNLLTRQKLMEAKRLEEFRKELQMQQLQPQAQPMGEVTTITPEQAISVGGLPAGPTVARANLIGQQVRTPVPQISEQDMLYQDAINKYRIAERYGMPEQAAKYLETALKIKPTEEFSTTPQYGVSAKGTPISFVMSKSGGMKLLDVNKSPDYTYQDFGSYVSVRDKSTNAEVERIAKTMSPSEVASNRIAMGNLNLRQQEFDRGAFDIKETPEGLVYVPKAPAGAAIPVMSEGGKPLEGAGSKPTEDQSKSAGFAFRMKQSTEIFNQPVIGADGKPILDPKTNKPVTLEQAVGQPNYYQSIMRAIPSAGLTTGIANISESGLRQQYRQAQQNWVTANLRPESGAVIGVDEMDKEIIKYFPQVSDTKETIEQKARARRDTELAMTVRAGPAYKQIQKAMAARTPRLVRDPATGILNYVQE
jgi:hypothetical protein